MASTLLLQGYPLLAPTGELLEFINNYIQLEQTQIFGGEPVATRSLRNISHTQHNVGVGLPNYPPTPKPELNQFYLPQGASRWATFYGVCDGDTAAALQGYSSNGSSPLTLTIGQSDNYIQTNMYLLPPRQLTFNESLWLLCLVDVRYFWKDQNTEEFEFVSESTWPEVMTALQSAVGVSFAYPDIPESYLAPDWREFSTKWYDNAAVLIDAVCHSLGFRFVVDVDGSMSVQAYEDADPTSEGENGDGCPAAGGDFSPENGGNAVPETVIVTFPRYVDGVADCFGAVYAVPIATGFGVAGTETVIHSSCYADFSDLVFLATVPNNNDQCVALATQITSDYTAWKLYQYDYVFNSVWDWEPNGFDNYYLYDHQKCLTRICSMPADFGVDQQLSQDPELFPLERFQYGQVTEQIVETTGGKVTIWQYDEDTSESVETDMIVTAYTVDGSTVEVSGENEFVQIEWHCEDACWYVISGTGGGQVVLVGVVDSESIETGQYSSPYSGCLFAGKILKSLLNDDDAEPDFCEGTGVFDPTPIPDLPDNDCLLLSIDLLNGSTSVNPTLIKGDMYIGLNWGNWKIGDTTYKVIAIRKGTNQCNIVTVIDTANTNIGYPSSPYTAGLWQGVVSQVNLPLEQFVDDDDGPRLLPGELPAIPDGNCYIFPIDLIGSFTTRNIQLLKGSNYIGVQLGLWPGGEDDGKPFYAVQVGQQTTTIQIQTPEGYEYGDTIVANDQGVFDAIQVFKDPSVTDYTAGAPFIFGLPCWLAFTDAYGGSLQYPPTAICGDNYEAVLKGVFVGESEDEDDDSEGDDSEDEGDERPLFQVRQGTVTKVIQVSVDNPLASGEGDDAEEGDSVIADENCVLIAKIMNVDPESEEGCNNILTEGGDAYLTFIDYNSSDTPPTAIATDNYVATQISTYDGENGVGPLFAARKTYTPAAYMMTGGKMFWGQYAGEDNVYEDGSPFPENFTYQSISPAIQFTAHAGNAAAVGITDNSANQSNFEDPCFTVNTAGLYEFAITASAYGDGNWQYNSETGVGYQQTATDETSTPIETGIPYHHHNFTYTINQMPLGAFALACNAIQSDGTQAGGGVVQGWMLGYGFGGSGGAATGDGIAGFANLTWCMNMAVGDGMWFQFGVTGAASIGSYLGNVTLVIKRVGDYNPDDEYVFISPFG